MKKAIIVCCLMLATVAAAQDKRLLEMDKSRELHAITDKIQSLFESAPTRRMLAKVLIQEDLRREIKSLTDSIRYSLFRFETIQEDLFYLSSDVELRDFLDSGTIRLSFSFSHTDKNGIPKKVDSEKCEKVLRFIVSNLRYFKNEDMTELGQTILWRYFDYQDGKVDHQTMKTNYELSYVVPLFFEVEVGNFPRFCYMNLHERNVRFYETKY